ncbi:MAG TPA: hypothetical protein VNI60_07735, partial [Pyrinomonadaceae bacterium]|nr:hypothetical protein [Pyrinomonadaceae bacterium]
MKKLCLLFFMFALVVIGLSLTHLTSAGDNNEFRTPLTSARDNDKFRKSKKPIPNRYIVVLNDNDDAEKISKELA